MDFFAALDQRSDFARDRLRCSRSNADANARSTNGDAAPTSDARAANAAGCTDAIARAANSHPVPYVYRADRDAVAPNQNARFGDRNTPRAANTPASVESDWNNSLSYQSRH